MRRGRRWPQRWVVVHEVIEERQRGLLASGLDLDRRNAGVPDQGHVLDVGAIRVTGLQSRDPELFHQIVDRASLAVGSWSPALKGIRCERRDVCHQALCPDPIKGDRQRRRQRRALLADDHAGRRQNEHRVNQASPIAAFR